MKEASNRTAFFSNDVILPAASGKGIKVGSYPTDANWTWRDLTSDIVTRGLGATDPTFTQVGSTAFRFTRWQVNDVAFINFHVPHDMYMPPSGNASVFFHVHWFVDDSASPTAGTCTWQWTFAFAKGFDQEAFDFSLANSPLTTANIVTAQQETGVPFQHMVTESVEVTIPGLSEPDGIICTQLKRIANTGSPTPAALSSDPFVITSDLHYKSTNIGTVGKAPSFYG